MVKNNRTNDKDLREGLTEKARLAAEEAQLDIRKSNERHEHHETENISEHEREDS